MAEFSIDRFSVFLLEAVGRIFPLELLFALSSFGMDQDEIRIFPSGTRFYIPRRFPNPRPYPLPYPGASCPGGGMEIPAPLKMVS